MYSERNSSIEFQVAWAFMEGASEIVRNSNGASIESHFFIIYVNLLVQVGMVSGSLCYSEMVYKNNLPRIKLFVSSDTNCWYMSTVDKSACSTRVEAIPTVKRRPRQLPGTGF
jgi:hypothetical protein